MTRMFAVACACTFFAAGWLFADNDGLVSAGTRSVPDYLRSAVVYQMVLRNFTRAGNFKAAMEMLEHVRSIGVDVVYLSPFVEADRDMDQSGWSKRMKIAGYGSPKNPYRIANYDRVDPEYGREADFDSFCERAHALGMKVYMDLVYMHCGPNNVIKDMFDDAFQRNPDGTVRTTHYGFPFVNFESAGVRKYLIDSMLHWVRRGCDGFRCDVGCGVPLDFWEEAVSACRKERPDLVMINEGISVAYLERAFDSCYAFPFSFALREFVVPETPVRFNGKFYNGETLPEIMGSVREYEAKVPSSALMFSFADNHDTAFDDGEMRMDRVRPVEAGNALFVLVFLRRGLPLIYNGNEIADNAMNACQAPVEHPLRANKTVDWGRTLQPAGQKRLALLRRLAKIRHEMPVFSDGTHEWVTDGEAKGVVAFIRRLGDDAVFVAANLMDAAAEFRIPQFSRCAAEPLMFEDGLLSSGGTCRLGPWGYVVARVFSSELETAAIQGRIDDAWRRGGGTVEIGAGVHKTGTLRLRSNVTLLLRSGAVLEASRNLADYDGWANDALEPVARPQAGDPNDYMRNWFRAVIRLHCATNAAIIGEPGSVIDGCNTFDPQGEERYRGAHGITAMFATNCVFRGYTMRRTGNWAHHFRMGRNLQFRDLKIDAGHDGIHMRLCDTVDIANCKFRTGDDSVAGFGNSNVHVHDCDISSACSAFRFGGRHVLVEDCAVHGPCDYPFRGSLPKEVKERGGEGAPGEGRRNMLSLFTYFSMKGYGLKENAGDIVLRNIRVSGADRFLQYNYSGNERWSTGVPMDGITFENVTATGMKFPLCAYGDATVPLSLTLRNCRLSFADGQKELIRGANLSIDFSEVEVEGVDGCVLRNYGPEVEIKASGLKGVKPSASKAGEPFSVKAI